MWKVTLRGLWARKLRFASTALAIVLGVGFLAGVRILTDTLGRTFEDLFASVYEGTDAVVQRTERVERGLGAPQARLDADVLERVRQIEGVEVADGYTQAYAQLVKRNGRPLGGATAPTFGMSWTTDGRLNAFEIADGRAPSGPGEIAIDRASANTGDFEVGDEVEVLSASPTERFEIVGIMTFGTADSAALSSAIAFQPAELARLAQTGGEVNAVNVVASPGVDPATLAGRIETEVGSADVEVLTGAEKVERTRSDIREQLDGFTTFLQAFAGLALFVAGFVISNTFAILVAQRTRDLALLRAVGASRRQVAVSVLIEALAVAIIGVLAGIAAGIGVAALLRSLFAAVGFELPSAGLVVSASTIQVSVLAGLVVTMASVLVPAWNAGKVAPLAALRQAAVDQSASSRLRLGIGSLIAALSGALVVIGLQGDGSPLTVGAAFGVAIVAVTVLGPFLTRPVTALVGGPVRRWRGITGRMAALNTVRSPRRTSRTAMALTIGVSVVTVVSVFTSSFTGLVERTVDRAFTVDYIVSDSGFTGFSPALADEVREVPGVDVVSGVRFGTIRVDGDRRFAAAFDTSTIDEVIDIPTLQGSLTDVGPGDIALGDSTVEERGWSLGDEIPVVFPDGGPTTLRLAAIVDQRDATALTAGGSAIISLETYDAGFAESLDVLLYVTIDDAADLDATGAAVDELLTDYPTAELQDQAEYKRSFRDQVNQFVAIIYVLLALSILIAVFGVANTLLLAIHERRHELGLLRAVGMTRAQTRATVRWESLIMAMLGVSVGMVLGLAFGVLLMVSLRDDGFTEIVLPWSTLAMVALSGGVFGILAGLRPAHRAAGLNILQAIATE